MNSDKVRIQEADEIAADARLPTERGEFRIRVFNDSETGMEHVALTLGEMGGPDPVLIRVHSECLTGDAFGSLRCDCGPQLDAAMSLIQEVGWGCILYLRQEGRGIGLHAKIQAYALQDQGHDTLDANLLLGLPGDARDFGISHMILESLDMTSIILLTNNPLKVSALEESSIEITERRNLVVGVNEHNREYLVTKLERMGHIFDANLITNLE